MIDKVFEYSPAQFEIFQNIPDNVFVSVEPKGRGLGYTYGAANTTIMDLMQGLILFWGDTTHANIKLYMKDLILPMVKKLGLGDFFKYDHQSGQLACSYRKNQFNEGGTCTFRSAENPKNWEGFGYDKIFLNEAGIILNNADLWGSSLLPMARGGRTGICKIKAGGTPKGKMTKRGSQKTDETHMYYTLHLNGLDKDKPDFMTRKKPFTMYDNPYIDELVRTRILNAIPSTYRDQEIYGKFVNNVDSVIKVGWLRETTIDISELRAISVGVDLAMSEKELADYSTIVVGGINPDNNFVIIHAERFKSASLNVIVNNIMRAADEFNAETITIESVQAQAYVVDELIRQNSTRSILPQYPQKDKFTRFLPIAAKYERGQIYHRHNLDSNFISELLNFSGHKDSHDDYIDALGYLITHLTTEIHSGVDHDLIFC